jgi:glycosyltransferase involved in cell wall biosynthesis
MPGPLITAIVSTYCAERFIRGCLDDLVSQTIFPEMEVLVIDSGSPQDESTICRQYAERYPQIRLVRTEREPLYVAWNRAIGLARGTYLTNANTDDRHRPDFAEVMVGMLERNRDAALAYADQYVSEIENETFAECEARGARRLRFPDFTPTGLMLWCITGSQPVWRRALHEEVGMFDPRYSIAADYDMWVRIGATYDLLHVNTVLGAFYDSPGTLSGSNNRLKRDLESLALKKRHIGTGRYAQSPDLRTKLADEVFGVGYRYITRDADPAAAAPFIREAIRLDPRRFSFMKTYLLRCFFRLGFPKQSRRIS